MTKVPAYPTFSGPDICKLQAFEVVALLKKGDISPQDLLEASRRRVEAVEPQINAMPTTCWTRAKQQTETLDSQSAQKHVGSLAGLPIGIKDLNAVKGVRTTFGTKGLADFIPQQSDPLVLRLEARGGLIVGKTNTPEFGAGGNTFNAVFGPTLNPWNRRLNAGGSSGGAAAQLATGQVWLSHGSDHGGSLRTPAAFCGIVGLRPSPGRAGGSSADAAFMMEGVQGPMARSVRDCALFLDAMAGFNPSSPLSFPAPEESFQASLERPLTSPRIAFSPDLGGFGAVESTMAQHLKTRMETLSRSGAKVHEAQIDTSGLEDTYHALRGLMWATLAQVLPNPIRAHFKETLEDNTRFGEALKAADFAQAQVGRSRLYARMLTLFEHCDVLALPVVGCMPQTQEQEWVKEIADQALPGYMDWLRFAFLATVTSLPAMSVPLGFSQEGLPIGLQLIGKPRGEADLLRTGHFVEQVMGGPMQPIDPQNPKVAPSGL